MHRMKLVWPFFRYVISHQTLPRLFGVDGEGTINSAVNCGHYGNIWRQTDHGVLDPFGVLKT